MARRTKPRRPARAAGKREPAAREPGLTPADRQGDAPRPTAARGGAPLDAQAEIERLDRLADLLDSRFRVPGLGWRFGLDSVIGLVPGVGDVAALGPSAYLVYRGYKLGADRGTLGRMAVNTGLDFVVGAIPLAGDVFDAAFKANRRNVELLKDDLRARGARSQPGRRR